MYAGRVVEQASVEALAASRGTPTAAPFCGRRPAPRSGTSWASGASQASRRGSGQSPSGAHFGTAASTLGLSAGDGVWGLRYGASWTTRSPALRFRTRQRRREPPGLQFGRPRSADGTRWRRKGPRRSSRPRISVGCSVTQCPASAESALLERAAEVRSPSKGFTSASSRMRHSGS